MMMVVAVMVVVLEKGRLAATITEKTWALYSLLPHTPGAAD